MALSQVAAEQLEDRDPLLVSQDHAWPPFSFADARGNPQGILIDIWREVGRIMDRPVEFRLTTWNESIQQVVRGEAMVHGGLLESPERRDVLTFSQDLLPLSAVIYIRPQAMVLAMEELGPAEIGVVDGSFELEYVRSEFPQLIPILYSDNDEMVRAAVRGEIDAFVVDYPVGIYLLDKYARPGDFNVLEPLYTHMIRAAVRHGDESLLEEIDHALDQLDPEELARITQRWMTVEEVERLPRWFLPGAAALLGLLGIAFVGGYIRLLLTRKAALEQLVEHRTKSIRQQEARFENIIEAGNLGTWDLDFDTYRMTVNDRWTEMIGYSLEELEPVTYQTWAARVHPDDLQPSEEAIHRHRNGETEYYDAEFRMKHKEGHWIWIQSFGRMLRPENGGVATKMYGCHLYIQQRKELELQVQQSQRMEGIGNLAGGIAHDLNNVLTPILISVDLMQEADTEEEKQRILESISENATRGADVVKQLMTYARGVGGEKRLVDLKERVESLARLLRETMPRNIRFTIRLPENPPPILADPTQIHQILLNLCVNARDAMPEGGQLKLRVTPTELGSEQAASLPPLQPGPVLQVDVVDDGCGIPSASLGKIFDPFYTTKELGKGTGLGLSTTLSLVEANQGALRVQSQVGVGTKFSLFFPAASEAPPSQAPAKKTTKQGRCHSILVVDDEPGVLHLVRAALVSKGHTVFTAANGQQALKVWEANPKEIDLVLTDMMMPEMNGSQLIQTLRGNAPELEIIAMSGLSQDDRLFESINREHLEVLGKPFTMNQLLEAVDKSCARL